MAEFAYVIDDEDAVRASLRALLGTAANRIVLTYADGESFLAEIEEREPGVVLIDLHMPGMSGMEIVARLASLKDRFPAIVVTGQGDIPLAVQAMRSGAIDFLEKPYESQAMFAAVDRGFALLAQQAAQSMRRHQAQDRLAQLSARERDIFDLLVSGASNKDMAVRLGLSVRTVEVHRAHVMEKLEAESLPAVLHLAYAAGAMSAAD